MVRILAATDFTEDNKAVLDFTANMVRQTGGKMYLLHAVEPCMMDAAGSMAADDIVDCVHDVCARHNIDILVIGNRHHSLLTSILLGNTAEKLVRAAKIPVTVVPCGPKAK